MDCSTPGLPVYHQFPEFSKTHVHWVGDPSSHLILCCPLLLPSSIFPNIMVFSDESVLCIRWPKYWSFSFSTSLYNEYAGPISLRMDLLDLLTGRFLQGTLKSLFLHLSSKASILQHSAFFIVQLSWLLEKTGKEKTEESIISAPYYFFTWFHQPISFPLSIIRQCMCS